MRAPLAVLGLVLSSAVPLASQAVITGVVREDSSGRPLAGAEVLIERTERRAVSGVGGRYVIADLPQGEYSALVRLVGYRPVRFVLRVQTVDTIWANVVLYSGVQTLDPVTVTGESRIPRDAHLRTFEENRRLGFGKFFDSTEIRRFENHRVSDLLRRVPGVQLVASNGHPCPNWGLVPCYAATERKVRPGGPACLMQVFVDGQPSRLRDLRSDFDLATLVGIEIYRSAAEVPAEYNSAQAACGVVALWTRRP